MYLRLSFIGLMLVCLPACWQPASEHVVIQETFMTQGNKTDDIDSPAVWHGPQGQHWLIATSKSADKLFIYDAATGDVIKTFGSSGTGPGHFKRPNGIAVVDDLAFIVERDNKRMQILHLPTMQLCGMTQGDLQHPYGIAVVQHALRTYDVYITDNPGPKNAETAKKIYQYRVVRAAGGCSINLVRIFGDESGPGALWKVESIAADPAYNRLFIADEHAAHKDIKIYTLDGNFTGIILGTDLFKTEPEGIALYPSTDIDGYIVATDQDRVNNIFWLFDRATLAEKGSFTGAVVRNTDGIALTHTSFGPFAEGALYAVHDDGTVGAFDWATIIKHAVMRDRLDKDRCD
jgi:3-phytase